MAAGRIHSLARSDDAAHSLRRRLALVALSSLSPQRSPPAHTALDDANRFIDALLEVPLPSWLAIGRALIADRKALVVRQAAWSDVEAAIGAYDLALAAWQVRDALETAICLVSRPVPRWSREERCQFAATHGAADAAALALLAQLHVRAEVVRILCGPFAPSVDFYSVQATLGSDTRPELSDH